MSDYEMSTGDVHNAIFYLGNFLRTSGITPVDALREMAPIQPKHAEFWRAAATSAEQGNPLSDCLKPILTPSTYGALHAAEASGTTEEVMKLLIETFKTEETVGAALRLLIKPSAMLVVGVAMIFFFSVVVIPPLSRTLPATNDPMLQFTSMLNSLYQAYGTMALTLLGITAAGILIWLRDPDNWQTFLGMAGSLPWVGQPLTNLYFGMWAFHMAISTRAGYVVTDALTLTSTVLPQYLQPAIKRIAEEAVQLGLIDASDPTNRPVEDPRARIPPFIAIAFRFAERTGDADQAFLAAGDGLIVQSVRQITVFATLASNIILPVAGILIGGSILPYFTQMGNAMDHLH